MSTIPRIIYTMWYREDGTDEEPPERYRSYQQSWDEHCADYEQVLLKTSDVEYMWQREPALLEFRSLFRQMKVIERCDFGRYALLLLRGGIYRDLNVHCYRNIAPLLESYAIAMAPEAVEQQAILGCAAMGNSFLASVAGHPFWLQLMRFIQANYKKDNNVLANTGPPILAVFARQYFRQFPEPYELPSCAVYPFVHTGALRMVVKSRECGEEMWVAKMWQDTACWGEPQNCRASRLKLWLLLFAIATLLFIVWY